jgi:hypothetical protein
VKVAAAESFFGLRKAEIRTQRVARRPPAPRTSEVPVAQRYEQHDPGDRHRSRPSAMSPPPHRTAPVTPGFVHVGNRSGSQAEGCPIEKAWEKRNPADASVNFLGIKAISATDVWAVGESRTDTATSVPGIVGHWDSVQVNSATDIWAAGQTRTDTAGANCRPYVVKYDGANWKEVATPTGLTGSLTKVVARGSGDVWVVGGTTALHWNGTGWTRADITLKGVTSFADLAFYGGQLYAGLHSGTDGAFARWNGQAWEAVTGPVSYSADGVRLTTATDGSLWVAGRTMSFFGSSSPFAARLAAPAAG